MLDALLILFLIHEDAAETEVGLWIVGTALEGLPVLHHRSGQVTLGFQHIA